MSRIDTNELALIANTTPYITIPSMGNLGCLWYENIRMKLIDWLPAILLLVLLGLMVFGVILLLGFYMFCLWMNPTTRFLLLLTALTFSFRFIPIYNKYQARKRAKDEARWRAEWKAYWQEMMADSIW